MKSRVHPRDHPWFPHSTPSRFVTVQALTASSAVLRFTANGLLKTVKREDMIQKPFPLFFGWIIEYSL